MTSKLKLNEVVLTSPNGLVEKSISMGDDGVVKVNGVQVADIVSGDFTPTIIGLTTAGTGQVYTVQIGKYIKIGNVVQVWGKVTMSNKGNPTGGILISGLPFTPSISIRLKCFISIIDNVTGKTLDDVHGTYLATSGGTVVVLGDSTGTIIDCSSLTNASSITFYASYPV